jgi:hypothetical protein
VATLATNYHNNISKESYWRSAKNCPEALKYYNKYYIYSSEYMRKPLTLKNLSYRANENLTYFEYRNITRDHSKTKLDNMQSLYKTMKYAKRIINSNITKNSRFLTLTYHENVQDLKKFNLDLNLFMKNLKNMLRINENITNLKYTIAREPQERGAWHAHIILYLKKAIFIDNDLIFKIWNRQQAYSKVIKCGILMPDIGYTKTQKVNHINNIGEYLASYLCNLEPIVGDSKKQHKKNKGARLKFYPSHMKIFTHSRNLLQPLEIINIHYENISAYSHIEETSVNAEEKPTAEKK